MVGVAFLTLLERRVLGYVHIRDIIYTNPTPRPGYDVLITKPELKEMQREAVFGLLQDYKAGSGQKALEEQRKQLSSECRNLQKEMQIEFFISKPTFNLNNGHGSTESFSACFPKYF